MSLLVGQCLKNSDLMKNKINLIAIEEKIVLKNYAKLTAKKKKEMIPLTNKKLSLMKNKKYVIYVKKEGFEMMIKTRKKSEIIVIIQENLEELLIANAV